MHWLGTDNLGRDILSRTMLGGRQALMVTSISTVMAIAWGGMLGVLLGLIGGWLENIVMRLVDAFLSIPWILFLLLIVLFVVGRLQQANGVGDMLQRFLL